MAARITLKPDWAEESQKVQTTILEVTIDLSNAQAMLSVYDMFVEVAITVVITNSSSIENKIYTYPHTFLIKETGKEQFLFETKVLGKVIKSNQVSVSATGYWMEKS